MSSFCNPASVAWALNQAYTLGDTDVFPRPFEFSILKVNEQLSTDYLGSLDLSDYNPRPLLSAFAPKHRNGFRICSQMDPIDFLIFSSLILDVSAQIESARIARSDRTVFSNRVNPAPNGRLFDQTGESYDAFQECNSQLALSGNYSHVLITDIADFYPRVYLHRVENSLQSILGMGHQHAINIQKFLDRWAGHYSYGIPVGTEGVRLISEILIEDVDQLLLSEGIRFTRFADDYRLFAKSKQEAHQQLHLLTVALYSNHGLTLAQTKTRILESEEFAKRYCLTPFDLLFEAVSEGLDQAIEHRFRSFYDFEGGELTTEERNEIESLQLAGLISEELSRDPIDISLTRYLLNRLRQVGDFSPMEELLNADEKVAPIIREVTLFLLHGLRDQSNQALREKVGEMIRRSFAGGWLGNSEFSLCWLARMIRTGWTDLTVQEVIEYEHISGGKLYRRELILALGSLGAQYWFRQRKLDFEFYDPWCKRAFIRGASCLPAQEYKHWVRGNQTRFDFLESQVATTSIQHPIVFQ
jgi:hypothetical protein